MAVVNHKENCPKVIYKIYKYGIIKIGNGETTKWFAWLYVKTHRPAKTDVFFYWFIFVC